MPFLGYLRLRSRTSIALVAAALLIAPTPQATAQLQAPPAPAAAAGSEAAVQQALARMRYVGGVIQNFPIAQRYYDVAPCYPLASSELALLNRWKAEFDAADAAFKAALSAYQTNWSTRTGAAGRAMLAGAQPPARYQTQAAQLRNRTSSAATKAETTIKARTKACPEQAPEG